MMKLLLPMLRMLMVMMMKLLLPPLLLLLLLLQLLQVLLLLPLAHVTPLRYLLVGVARISRTRPWTTEVIAVWHVGVCIHAAVVELLVKLRLVLGHPLHASLTVWWQCITMEGIISCGWRRIVGCGSCSAPTGNHALQTWVL